MAGDEPGRKIEIVSPADWSTSIGELLLAPDEALRLRSHGSSVAAVLIPLVADANGLTTVFTRRHANMRRHAGEISFPGGRRDTGEDLRQTALREAEEEIGLPREEVQLLGALPPTSTFVTNYSVYPFVGLIEPNTEYKLSPREVEEIVEIRLEDLVAGYERKRLIKMGVPIKTDSYTVADRFIWGATARIVSLLLKRLEPLIGSNTSSEDTEMETAGDDSPAEPDEQPEAAAG